MALLKVSEFAKTYNLNRNNVYTYKGRGKLILVDGYLDEDNPINKVFIDSRETSFKVKTKPSVKKEHKTIIPESENIEDSKIFKDTDKKTKKLLSKKIDPIYIEFTKTEELRNQKLKEEVKLMELRRNIAEHKLIPTEMVQNLLPQIFQNYQMSFLQQTEQLIRDVLNELLASNEKITTTCSKLIDIANQSSKLAVSKTKSTINNITCENIKL